MESNKIDENTIEVVNRQRFRKESLIEEKKGLEQKLAQINELLSVLA
tara:strand:+ start:1372 stop:1512 length:141 start_codon:yes stop_codon:yes gene_type:complete